MIIPCNDVKKRPHLLFMLICLTTLFLFAQGLFFFLHYKVSGLIDIFAANSVLKAVSYPVIFLPIILFVGLQVTIYGLLICWLWFISTTVGRFFKLTQAAIYFLGLANWFFAIALILISNYLYFPNSFFAEPFYHYPWLIHFGRVLAWILAVLLSLFTLIAYGLFFLPKKEANQANKIIGYLLLVLLMMMVMFSLYEKKDVIYPDKKAKTSSLPDIILIGIDSLRPDFVHSLSKQAVIRTTHIDQFLQESTVFTEAYTPLARTFPAWISILTAKYPKHHTARNNLSAPQTIVPHLTLARQLQQAGYETMYLTDEKRFSNITEEYGFDHVFGPSMGVNDFLLGGLGDFPLSNLLIRLPIGRVLLPYHYANRAVNVTYEPDQFLQLVRLGLKKRSDKPLFLAIHLCLSHWPFTWAKDNPTDQSLLSERYRHSVEVADEQLIKLLAILRDNQLLEKSWVVLLSDHGTALGLLGDRITDKKNYLGDKKNLNVFNLMKLSTAPVNTDRRQDYVLNTSYGQGNDVLSLTQHRVVLAFKAFGMPSPIQHITERVSLLDIAPTILDWLHLPALPTADGSSLAEFFSPTAAHINPLRPFYIEAGDKIIDAETDKIVVEKILKKRMGAYDINSHNGLLTLKPTFEKAILKNKQRAVLYGDWLLVYYPDEVRLKLTSGVRGKLMLTPYEIKPYFVLANIKTQKWTIGLTDPWAKTAPLKSLLHEFNRFYGDEAVIEPR